MPTVGNRCASYSPYGKRGRSPHARPAHAVFPSLDNFKYKDKWWVIDIGGNNLRMIAFIEFRDNRLYVKHIVTHAEYDKLCRKYAKESD